MCGGNKKGTRQELLAATHCILASNGWNLTTTMWVCTRVSVCVCLTCVRVRMHVFVGGCGGKDGVCVVHAYVQINMVECKHHKNGCS